MPIIAPSMLKCDYGNLQQEVERLEAARARWLHWDVMDGNFVPNLSYGAMVIRSLRRRTTSFFDAHLMIADPEKYLDDYLQAGCDAITVHIEAVPNPTRILQRIREAGRVAGLALNPGTAIEALDPYLSLCGLVLVMSVQPGFGGQAFQPAALEKVKRLKPRLAPGTLLSIDGGIARDTIGLAAAAGCEVFVAGSAIFDEADYTSAVATLRQLALPVA